MAKIKLNGDTSGYIEISAPAVSGNNTLELGPGTRILTNLDNTFTGVSTFTSGLHVTGGSFGLGTDNPDATLKVNVASGNNGVVVQNTSTANIALLGARNGDATVQIGQWGSTASGSTFGLSNADLSFIYTTSYSTTHPSALALGTVSNKPIVFATNNTERLRITSDGNIGVGGATGTDYSLLDGIVTNTANGSAGLLINSSSSSHNAYMSFGYGSGSGTSHADQFSAYIGRVGDNTLILGTDNNIRVRLDPSGHLLHGVSADEDTSGNGGLRFINSGDIQIDGDQKALVFRSTNNTAQLQSAIEWWNENGAGVQSKIACDRTAVSQAPSDLVFYTSPNVDTGGTSSDGDITERVRIASDGTISIGVPGRNTSGGWRVKLVVPDNSSYQSALNVTNNVNADCQIEIKTNESRFGPSTNTPLVFKTDNTERIRITNVGRMGIDSTAPISKLQVGSHTFNGGNGMHSDDRVGMSNHGQLTGLMLASTYNDGAHPEYGLVFVQGPNTSSYNVWGVCPDGPAKGNSLNFHYAPQGSNIHSPGYRKFQMTGDGYFLQSSQPAFRVGRSSNYNPGAGSDIIFDSISGDGRFNQGGHYSTSNGRFTAPVNGRYMFTAHVIYQSLGSGQDMADCWTIQMNNTVVGYSGRRGEYIANETGNGGYYTDWNTFILQMSANDFVTITNARNLTVHGNSKYTTFAGYLIG